MVAVAVWVNVECAEDGRLSAEVAHAETMSLLLSQEMSMSLSGAREMGA